MLTVDLLHAHGEINVLLRGQLPDVVEIARLVASSVGERHDAHVERLVCNYRKVQRIAERGLACTPVCSAG